MRLRGKGGIRVNDFDLILLVQSKVFISIASCSASPLSHVDREHVHLRLCWDDTLNR